MMLPLGQFDDDKGMLVLSAELVASVLKMANYTSLLSLPSPLIVDGRAVKTCDSVGIAAILWLVRQVKAVDGQVKFIHIPDCIQVLLALYALKIEDLNVNAR